LGDRVARSTSPPLNGDICVHRILSICEGDFLNCGSIFHQTNKKEEERGLDQLILTPGLPSFNIEMMEHVNDMDTLIPRVN
jgi:hypothetical protein